MGQITFGPFAFDQASATLTREGKPVALGGRGLAILQALVEANGAVVGKTELMEKVWPGQIVEEGNLTVQMAGLRKALGAKADGTEWIVTVPRVGYRLVRAASVIEEAIPNLPSVAVLPFDNLSGDTEQEYFADGVVEDIINALSRFRSFAVVARHSSFVYKGRSVDVRDVARELGVRYVLEGSVRRAGDRIRITAQLIEGANGNQLWAEKYDGALGDIFEMQDRVTENVVAIVEPRLRRAEIERARRKHPERLDAYDLYLRALPGVYSTRPGPINEAIELLERSAHLDPALALAHTMASHAYLLRGAMQLEGTQDDDAARAIRHARRALAIADDDPAVLGQTGFVLVHMAREYEEGFALLRRAVAENPNSTLVLNCIGVASLLGGDLDEGEAFLKHAVELNPADLGTHWQLSGIAHIQIVQGRYEEALGFASRSLAANPGYDPTYWMLIAGNAYLGNMDVARGYIRGLQGISPGVTLSRIRRGQHARDPRRIDVLIEGMRLAGLAE